MVAELGRGCGRLQKFQFALVKYAPSVAIFSRAELPIRKRLDVFRRYVVGRANRAGETAARRVNERSAQIFTHASASSDRLRGFRPFLLLGWDQATRLASCRP